MTTTPALQPDLAINAGIDYTGCIPARPAMDPSTKKWTQANIGPEHFTVTAGPIVEGKATSKAVPNSYRCVVITSTGAATPAHIDSMVRVTSNGNYLVNITREAIPAEAQAARTLANSVAKAEYQALKAANGGVVPKATRQAVQVTFVADTATPATPATPSKAVTAGKVPYTPAEIAELQAAGYTIGQILAMAQATPATPATPAGKVPKLAPKTK